MKRFIRLVFQCLVLVTAAQAAELTGIWLFSAETGDGVLQPRLTLQAAEPRLSARLEIDRHVLEGSGTVKGDEFDVQLQHAVSPGSDAIVADYISAENSMATSSKGPGLTETTAASGPLRG